MATTTESSLLASSIGVAFVLWARSTLTLFWSMGVMTMKMISSTSITSTMGVTLILALTLAPSFLTAIAISVRSDRIFMAGATIRGRERLRRLPAEKILAHLRPVEPNKSWP